MFGLGNIRYYYRMKIRKTGPRRVTSGSHERALQKSDSLRALSCATSSERRVTAAIMACICCIQSAGGIDVLLEAAESDAPDDAAIEAVVGVEDLSSGIVVVARAQKGRACRGSVHSVPLWPRLPQLKHRPCFMACSRVMRLASTCIAFGSADLDWVCCVTTRVCVVWFWRAWNCPDGP